MAIVRGVKIVHLVKFESAAGIKSDKHAVDAGIHPAAATHYKYTLLPAPAHITGIVV